MSDSSPAGIGLPGADSPGGGEQALSFTASRGNRVPGHGWPHPLLNQCHWFLLITPGYNTANDSGL